MEKLIQETEDYASQLDVKLLNLRKLSSNTQSFLDKIYGALAHDPVPMKFSKDCVYTLVSYGQTKTQLFDLEFWFKLDEIPIHSMQSSVLMVGRRAFTGHTQMFALTVEAPNANLQFSWNVPSGKILIDSIKAHVWYQIRIVSYAGEIKIFLIERLFETTSKPMIVRTFKSDVSKMYPEGRLILDDQMEIRIGGITQSGSRLVNPEAWGDNGAEQFWTKLMIMDTISFCIFNLKLAGKRTSIVNFAHANSECTKPKDIKCQL